MSWEKYKEARNRPFTLKAKCAGGCGKSFGKKDVVFVHETQISWFRGDDICEAYCPECHAEKLASDRRPDSP